MLAATILFNHLIPKVDSKLMDSREANLLPTPIHIIDDLILLANHPSP
jgi:hypothetical protein